MQRCNVYDVIKTVLDGGYVVLHYGNHGNRTKIRLYALDKKHGCGQLVGCLTISVFDALCESGFLQFERRGTDKSKILYDFYGFKECDENAD